MADPTFYHSPARTARERMFGLGGQQEATAAVKGALRGITLGWRRRGLRVVCPARSRGVPQCSPSSREVVWRRSCIVGLFCVMLWFSDGSILRRCSRRHSPRRWVTFLLPGDRIFAKYSTCHFRLSYCLCVCFWYFLDSC